MGGGGSAGGSGGSGPQGGSGGSDCLGNGGAPTGWEGTVPTMKNDASCLSRQLVHPDPGEEGHLFAVRLTAPVHPYHITDIQYELVGAAPDCDSSFAHRVEVFVSGDIPPPAIPSDVTTLNIPAGNDECIRIVQQTLPSPITLTTSADSLYVAVQLPHTNACLGVCGNAVQDNRDYWSNTAAAPYVWATMASLGINLHARVGANGQTIP